MNKIFVKPKEGLKVQKCYADFGRKELIKSEGENVPNTLYYRRLIKRGELLKVEPEKTKTTKKNGGK